MLFLLPHAIRRQENTRIPLSPNRVLCIMYYNGPPERRVLLRITVREVKSSSEFSS